MSKTFIHNVFIRAIRLNGEFFFYTDLIHFE